MLPAITRRSGEEVEGGQGPDARPPEAVLRPPAGRRQALQAYMHAV